MRNPIRNRRNNNNMLYERIMQVVDRSVRKALNESITENESEPENITGIGQTFRVISPNYYKFEVENRDIEFDMRNIVISKYKSNPLKLTSRARTLAKSDITLNTIIAEEGDGDPHDPYYIELDDQNELTVSVFDLGWDSYVDAFKETIREIDNESTIDDDGSTKDYYFNRLVTFRYFDYYNEFSNEVASELKKIYGYAQECYEGFDEDRFISGYDVAGGSILLIMPIGADWEYKIVDGNVNRYPEAPSESYRNNATALYRPTSFYGPDNTHFYNTKQGKDIYGKSELGFDLRLD